jgi:transposase
MARNGSQRDGSRHRTKNCGTLGYRGGHTILRDYVHIVRPQLRPNRAFLRMEPPPGERFEVDWGHFGTLDYQGDKRKLYAFALVEAHIRMLYLEFTHSQTFETLRPLPRACFYRSRWLGTRDCL